MCGTIFGKKYFFKIIKIYMFLSRPIYVPRTQFQRRPIMNDDKKRESRNIGQRYWSARRGL